MAYSEHPGTEDFAGSGAPESGDVQKTDPDEVVVGDGFTVDSLHGVNVDFRLRLLEAEYPELRDIRRRCAQLGLDDKPLLETVGMENTIRNFCCQLINYIDVVVHYFNHTIFDEENAVPVRKNERISSPIPLLLRLKRFAEPAKTFVSASRLPGKELIDLMNIQEQAQRLLARFDG